MTPEYPEHDELIVRSLQGIATPEDERQLAILRESPAFRRYHNATVALWAHSAAERERQHASMPVPDVVLRRLLLRRSTGEFPIPRTRHTRRWLVAATLLVAVGGGMAMREGHVILPFFSDDTTEYSTRATETATVTLDDGSVAHLAPRSRLRIVRSRLRHGLQLEGRAFFAVSRARSRPLLVYTNRGIVEVARGRFDVESSPAATRVVIVDGEVMMEATGGRVSSHAGYALRATATSVTSDSVADVAAELEWMRGFLAFRNTPLRSAVRDIEHFYGVKVLVADEASDRTVTAWFEHRQLEDVLAVISRVTYTSYSLEGGVVRIGPATSPPRTPPSTGVGG